MKYLILTLLVLCMPLASVTAAETGYARPHLLLEASELAQPAVAKQYVILDVRSPEAYDEAHIPGALRVDHGQWKAAFDEGKQVQEWSERIAQLGIKRDSKVVVYDDNRAKDAARVWWLLRYWGLEDARLLNGGWKAWTANELPTTGEATPAPEATDFQAKPRPARLATRQSLLDRLGNRSLQVVDARSLGEFCGTAPGKNERSGAIPGARHLEWSDLIDPETHRFKSADEISALLKKAQIDLNRPLVTHCQSGGRASVMAFGLELMGGDQVSNYYRGWSEWGNDPSTPIEPGKESDSASSPNE